MTYRPYPNADRALKQLDRHYSSAPVIQMPECLRPIAESFDRLRDLEWDRAMSGSMWRPGLLIERSRPRVVGGES